MDRKAAINLLMELNSHWESAMRVGERAGRQRGIHGQAYAAETYDEMEKFRMKAYDTSTKLFRVLNDEED
jgi:hypothetical protein